MSPLLSAVSCLTIGSPRPKPLALVVYRGSKIRAKS